MQMLNNVLIEGILRSEPYKVAFGSKAGTTLVKFDIENIRTRKDSEDSCFLTVQTWGAMAEAVLKNLKCGMNVRVVGSLKQNNWKKGGVSYTSYEILAQYLEFQNEISGKTAVAEGGDKVQ